MRLVTHDPDPGAAAARLEAQRSYGPRRAGSVRFDPYFKVQWWVERNLSWLDVQRKLPTLEEARDEAGMLPDGTRWRIMRITPESREPVEEGVSDGS